MIYPLYLDTKFRKRVLCDFFRNIYLYNKQGVHVIAFDAILTESRTTKITWAGSSSLKSKTDSLHLCRLVNCSNGHFIKRTHKTLTTGRESDKIPYLGGCWFSSKIKYMVVGIYVAAQPHDFKRVKEFYLPPLFF